MLRRKKKVSKIYIFSGLGVDKRVFDNINFENFNVEFIDWTEPLPQEDIKKYARKTHNFISDWFFGTESNADKTLLRKILKDTDSRFLTWAVNEILNWKNNDEPKNWVHIHGDQDRIIPLKNVRTTYMIKGGGHFMTVNKAKEIEVLLKSLLA